MLCFPLCSVKRIYFKHFEATTTPRPLKIPGTMKIKVFSESKDVEALKCVIRYDMIDHYLVVQSIGKLKLEKF